MATDSQNSENIPTITSCIEKKRKHQKSKIHKILRNFNATNVERAAQDRYDLPV